MEVVDMKRSIMMLAVLLLFLPLTAGAETDIETSTFNEEELTIAENSKATESSGNVASQETDKGSSKAHYLIWWEDDQHEIAWEQVKEENRQDTQEAVAEDILLN